MGGEWASRQRDWRRRARRWNWLSVGTRALVWKVGTFVESGAVWEWRATAARASIRSCWTGSFAGAGRSKAKAKALTQRDTGGQRGTGDFFEWLRLVGMADPQRKTFRS